MTTDRTASDDDRAREQRRALGALSLCLLVAWILLLMPLPWSLGAGALGLVAAVLLVRACRAMWRTGQRGSAVATALLGAGAVLVLVGSAVVSAALYGPMHELQECRRDALTQKSLDICQDRATTSTTEWIGSLLGS